MPASAGPEREEAVSRSDLTGLTRLEAAVGRLLEELAAARERGERAEAACRKLRAALEANRRQAGASGDLEARLERLAEENRRLKQTLAAARERAERIRSRLMVVEDEL